MDTLLQESKELVQTNQQTHDNAMMVEMDKVNSKNELYVSVRSKHKQEKERVVVENENSKTVHRQWWWQHWWQ
jgi:hypothetical protein